MSACKRRAHEAYREREQFSHNPFHVLSDKICSGESFCSLLEQFMSRFERQGTLKLWRLKTEKFYDPISFSHWYHYYVKINRTLRTLRSKSQSLGGIPFQIAFDKRMDHISKCIQNKKLIKSSRASAKKKIMGRKRKIHKMNIRKNTMNKKFYFVNTIGQFFMAIEKERDYFFQKLYHTVTAFLTRKVLRWSPHGTTSLEIDYSDIFEVTFTINEVIVILEYVTKKISFFQHHAPIYVKKSNSITRDADLFFFDAGKLFFSKIWLKKLELNLIKDKKNTRSNGSFSILNHILETEFFDIEKVYDMDENMKKTNDKNAHVEILALFNKILLGEENFFDTNRLYCVKEINHINQKIGTKILMNHQTIKTLNKRNMPQNLLILLLLQEVLVNKSEIVTLNIEIKKFDSNKTKLKRELSTGEPKLERFRADLEEFHYSEKKSEKLEKNATYMYEKANQKYLKISQRLRSFFNSLKILNYSCSRKYTEINLLRKLFDLNDIVALLIKQKKIGQKK
jgi:hypothetical protein